MRKSLAVTLVVASFGLGAWLSPRLAASVTEDFPLSLQKGQRVSVVAPPWGCEIQRAASMSRKWVECKEGYWLNLATGSGFRIHEPSK